MSDDIVFGPAASSSNGRVLVGRSRRVAVRKQKVPAKQVTPQDIIVFARPENLRLIPIADRNAPDFCEACGIEHGLFWTGSMVLCIQCSKDAKLLRKEGMSLTEKAKTPQEFLTWLAHQKYLVRRLFDGRS